MADEDETTPPDEETPPEQAPAEDAAPADAPEEEAPAAATPPADAPAGSPSLDDVFTQIQAIPVGSFLLSTVSTLASIAYGKLGANELDEARGAIDAIRALLPVLEGRIESELKRDFEQALANLQVAYADASARASS